MGDVGQEETFGMMGTVPFAGSQAASMDIAVREPVPPIPVEPSPVFTITVPFYVYPQGDRWYAASTEYLVMAQGDTADAALHAFVGAAEAYIATALARGWMDALNRRPPLWRRWEIRLRYVLARALRRGPSTTSQPLTFDWSSLRLA